MSREKSCHTKKKKLLKQFLERRFFKIGAEIIFVHYEKITVIRFPVSQKIPQGEKCADCYGKLILLCNDGNVVWKAIVAGMHGVCSCIQLFSGTYLPQSKRKKLKEE